MKKLLWPLVIVSLALNVGLAAWVTLREPSHAKATNPAPVAIKDAGPAADSLSLWARLQGDDTTDMVRRLRTAGFPPDIVRAIVTAQVQQEFNARRKALDPDYETRPFWKEDYNDPKMMAVMRQLSREQRDRLRELLGADAESGTSLASMIEDRRFGVLSPEKKELVRGITRDFQDKQNDLFATLGGAIGVSAMGKLDALRKEEREALAKVLSPEELTNFDLRSSQAATRLRSVTVAFNPTEEEFMALYKINLAHEELLSPILVPDEQTMRRRNEIGRQMNDEIKAALGPARYADYEKAAQPDYRDTSLLVGRLELPPETTEQVWAVRNDIMQQATAIRTNRSLAPDQRNAQLTALQQQAAAAITPLIGGPRGYEAYRQYGGQWLQRLVPPAAVTPPSR